MREKSLERAGQSPVNLRVALELGSNEAIKEAVLRGVGIAILSTNQGLLTDREARARNVGGEVLCTVW